MTEEFSAENPPKVGDIVQVGEQGPREWFRCLIVVDEIKTWGIQGYVTLPGGSERTGGDAFNRLEWHEIVPTGGVNRYVVVEGPEPSPRSP